MKNFDAIDETVERFEHSAEFERTHGNLMGCQEFKQLAGWLRELKAYKEQQPCEDAISRDELLKNQTVIVDDDGLAHKVVHVGRICAAPSVNPEQKTGKWIKLKDQKPEAYEDVLVRDINGEVRCAHMLDESILGISFYEAFGGECIEDVVEWRELPE